MLSRRDPFRDMEELRRTMNRFFEDSLVNPIRGFVPQIELPMDVTEDDQEYVVKASVPGINPDDLEITYTDKTLTISGQVQNEGEPGENTRYHMRERWFGNFSRSIVLPTNIDANKISADYHDGILTLHLPKTEEVKPKRISVHSTEKSLKPGSGKNQ